MNAKFYNSLRVTQVAWNPKDIWRLEVDLVYFSALLNKLIIVPEGFETDFASVPRLPFTYLLAGGKANAAAVVHDYMYSEKEYSRKDADDVFYEAIKVLGHSEFTAWIMWLGVRIGGGFARKTKTELVSE